MDDLRSQCIQTIDDHLRKNPTADVAIMTPGIAALGQEATDRIIKTITVFDDFCHAHDPGDEHDTGSFEAEGHTILYKIDHYERLPESLTPKPADQMDRVRVITVRLAEDD
jgi:Protein of unknown function (DUF3768)